MQDSTSQNRPDASPHIPVKLIFGCVMTAMVILLIDINIPLGVAGGVPYIVTVLLTLKAHNRKFTLAAAAGCTALTILGFYLSPSGGELWKVIANRTLAVFAIWVTAILALIQQTREQELFEERLKVMDADRKIEIQTERLKVLKATMRTVHDIVGNFLNNLQLYQLRLRKRNALAPEALEEMETLIHDTSTKLKKLADVDTVRETRLGTGEGIDYGEAG